MIHETFPAPVTVTNIVVITQKFGGSGASFCVLALYRPLEARTGRCSSALVTSIDFLAWAD